MNAGQGFDLHPGAARDITEIWEFIAEDNPLAAGRVREPMLVVAVLHGRRSPRVIAAILRVRGRRRRVRAPAPHRSNLLDGNSQNLRAGDYVVERDRGGFVY
jgi:hypothetical protein